MASSSGLFAGKGLDTYSRDVGAHTPVTPQSGATGVPPGEKACLHQTEELEPRPASMQPLRDVAVG